MFLPSISTHTYTIYFHFQATLLGTRIDLRTVMGAILNPTSIKEIMELSQQLRIMYYHLRITTMFLEGYKSVRSILAKVYIRRWNSGLLKEDKKKMKDDLFNYQSKQTMKKTGKFGRIIQDCFKDSMERLSKKIQKLKALEIPDDDFESDDEDDLVSTTSSRSSTFSKISSIHDSSWNARKKKS